jgi:hypothetical protein
VFSFPQNTLVQSNGYLVLKRDTAEFGTYFPGVENIIGNMDFGFNNNGELLRLFDSTGVVIDTVHYLSESPWPTEPNGNGPTLELKYWAYDNALPESWAASENHGTPGAMNGYVVGTNEDNPLDQKGITFTIYPNPLHNEAILQITSYHKLKKAKLLLFNTLGTKVREYSGLSGERFVFKKNGLNPGLYVCVLMNNKNHIVGKKKIMVK